MKLNPYLSFDGNCEEALNFYAKCLNGKVEALKRFSEMPGAKEEDKNLVMHGILKFGGDCILFASDGAKIPSTEKNNNISLSLDFDSVDDINNAFAKFSEGGKVTMPIENTFWNARFGMCTDKYGIAWLFNHDLPKK